MASSVIIGAGGIDGIWTSVSIAEILALMLTFALFAAFRRRYLAD